MEGYGCLEKWGDLNFDGENGDQENEEMETLSLCDLPVSVIKEGNEDTTAKETTKLLNCEENFDFGSWGGSVLMESEMCAADEVFFQGQILPLRLSVSSENGVLGNKLESKNSRSESMERCSSSGVSSLSSRSNSTGSHNSNSTSTTITTTTTSTYKPKFRNQFHSHPSPKPQILTIPKIGNVSNRSRKSSTVWGIFKVGLIRTPEMELQELKLRNSNNNRSINSRSSSGSSSRMSHLEVKADEKNTMKKKKTERFLFEGCKCSPDTVDTVIVRKNKKVINLNESKEEEDDEMEKVDKEKTEKQKKQALHHRRTFEWLRELSIADVPEEL